MNPLNVKIKDEQGKPFNPDALVNTFIEGRRREAILSRIHRKGLQGVARDTGTKYHKSITSLASLVPLCGG
jgi:hypothetical protein